MASPAASSVRPPRPKKEPQALVIPKNAAEEQKLKLERLMKNPDKAVPIPEKMSEWAPRPPPEFVRDVMEILDIKNNTEQQEPDYDKNTCTTMFTAALFTIAKIWKQPRCLTTDEWFQKMWHLYTMEFYTAIRKDKIMAFAGKWMEVEQMLSEISQEQRQMVYGLLDMWALELKCKEIKQSKQVSRYQNTVKRRRHRMSGTCVRIVIIIVI